MKLVTKRTGAVLSSLCLLCSVASSVTASADFSNDTIKGTFFQNVIADKNANTSYKVETYTYSDALFNEDNGSYLPSLATSSAYLAMASTSSARYDSAHGLNRDIKALLEDIGFSNVASNEDYYKKPETDTMGVTCGMKAITDKDGKTYTLLAIVPRSAGYGAEWASNFKIGEEGNASGFEDSTKRILEFVNAYASTTQLSGDVKVWISGYSRGGAVANMAAAALTDNASFILGENVNLTSDNIYAYTFEAPMGASVENNPRDDRYAHIFNIISVNDVIPYLASAKMGFDRYGTDHIVEENISSEKMMCQLAQIDPILAWAYSDGYSPAGFKKRLLGMAVDGSTETFPEDVDSKNNLPDNQAEFAKLLADSITNSVSDRTEYTQNVEPYLSEIVSIFLPALTESGLEIDTVKQAALQSNYGLSLLVDLYMDYELSRIPYVIQEYTENPEQVELFFNKTNRLAILLRVMAGDLSEQEMEIVQGFVSNLSPEEQVWVQEVFGDFSPEALELAKEKTGFSKFNLSEECVQEVKEIFALYCSFITPAGTVTKTVLNPETGEPMEVEVPVYTSFTQENYETETAFIQQHLAESYKNFMTEFLTVFEVPAEVTMHQTEETACAAMPKVLEAILLDSPDRTDIYAEDIEDGESVSKFATILGNAGNLIYTHAMSTVLAWVRAEDPNYVNYVADTSQNYGYRRINIQKISDGDTNIHGKILDDSGNEIAEFEGYNLTSSGDEWITITSDYLRLPANQGYTIELTSDETTDFSVAIGEYNTFEGTVVNTFTSDDNSDWSNLTIAEGDTYIIDVPAVENLTVDWTADNDNNYTITKKEAEQKPTEEEKKDSPKYDDTKLGEMAVTDYTDKTGVTPEKTEIEHQEDGTVTIRIMDEKETVLDVYTVDPNTAVGTNLAGEDIDLPQTGTNSPVPALGLFGSLTAMLSGLWFMKKSKIFNRK